MKRKVLLPKSYLKLIGSGGSYDNNDENDDDDDWTF